MKTSGAAKKLTGYSGSWTNAGWSQGGSAAKKTTSLSGTSGGPTKPKDTFQTSNTQATAQPAAAPSSKAEQLVTELYDELLLRPPDSGGLAFWSKSANQLLADGMSPSAVKAELSSEIQKSEEFQVVDTVRKSFEEVLGRAPTERGYWHDVAFDMRKNGASLEQISQHLERAHAQSEEYKLQHPEQMISGLYRKLLMREPDSSGMKTWTDEAKQLAAQALSSADIESVISGKLRASDEYQVLQIVNRAFEEELGRTPEAKGTWHELALQLQQDGKSHGEIDQVIRGHLRESEEYKQKHPEDTGWVGKVPELNQNDPKGEDAAYYNGDSNCGPTALAMVARAAGYGAGMTDSQLIMDMFKRCGTQVYDGTGADGIVAGARSLGMQASATMYSTDVNKMAADLKAGNIVIANGDWYALAIPGRVNNKDGGHFITVEGLDGNGNFIINEPWDGREYVITPAQMQKYLAEWSGSGGNWITIDP